MTHVNITVFHMSAVCCCMTGFSNAFISVMTGLYCVIVNGLLLLTMPGQVLHVT